MRTEAREAISGIWRNLPSGVSTFSACPTEGCKGAGRGGGKCVECWQNILGEVSDPGLAHEYVEAVREVRALEDMIDRVSEGKANDIG